MPSRLWLPLWSRSLLPGRQRGRTQSLTLSHLSCPPAATTATTSAVSAPVDEEEEDELQGESWVTNQLQLSLSRILGREGKLRGTPHHWERTLKLPFLSTLLQPPLLAPPPRPRPRRRQPPQHCDWV